MSRSHLVLFSEHFPFGGGETFLGLELPYLADAFERITIVPRCEGTELRRVPSNVHVDVRFENGLPHRLRPEVSALLWPTLDEVSPQWLRDRPYAHARRLMRFVRTADRVVRWFDVVRPDLDDTLFYSFWLEAIPAGLGALKRRFPKLTYVSRAGGWDVYEDRAELPWYPLRTLAVDGASRIFTHSLAGAQHLLARHPGRPIDVHGMGVPDFGRAAPSDDGVLRVVSCSSILPVKRVDLIADAIASLGRTRRVQWTHLGAGPLLEEVRGRPHPEGVEVRLLGHTPHDDVLDYYRTNPVDVFVNASTSEGRPVSIMEALSAGVPIVATDVGGSKELVLPDAGRMVPSDVSPEALGAALAAAAAECERDAARATWRERCDATAQYADFTRILRSL